MKSHVDLLKRPGVVAVGRGRKVVRGDDTGDPAITVSVVKKKPISQLRAAEILPQEIDGIRADVIEVGVLRAQSEDLGAQYTNPVTPGMSCGHYAITAGTIGCFVQAQGGVCILSNNHVLANSNAAEISDDVLVPGPYDGGKRPGDVFAKLIRFERLKWADGEVADCKIAPVYAAIGNAIARLLGSNTRIPAPVSIHAEAALNLVDAALAIVAPEGTEPWGVCAEIPHIGWIAGLGSADIGMAIQKTGRTTGHTTGKVLQVDVTAKVEYGAGRVAIFTDQIIAGPMSQPGDSGSAVLTTDNRLVGLLFAGSDQATIINRIEHVFSLMGCVL